MSRRTRTACAIIFAAGLVAGASGAAHGAESVYTDLDLDACETLAEFEEGGGVELRCEGHDGLPVYVSEGDLRFDVDFGSKNEAFQTFGPFNNIHNVVEWRVGDGAAHAAILRFFLDTGLTGGPEDRAEVLLVSKVGYKGAPGCAMAAVDAAIEQANGVARGAAAMAATFDCASDAPIAIGPEGSMATALSGSVPEGNQ